jgi:hypothetical protein
VYGSEPIDHHRVRITPHFDIAVPQQWNLICPKAETGLVSKGKPIPLSAQVASIVWATIALVEFHEMTGRNAENGCHALDLFRHWLEAENFPIIQNQSSEDEIAKRSMLDHLFTPL